MHALPLILAAILFVPWQPAEAETAARTADASGRSSGTTGARGRRATAPARAASTPAAPPEAGAPAARPRASSIVTATVAPVPLPGAGRHEPENLLAGPARCVLRYLEALRLAGPRVDARSGRLPPVQERDHARVKALTAPRTLDEIDRRAAAGGDHPLAPWREASRARVLESFQLLAVRRAPRGAAIVTVAESFRRRPGVGLERSVAEYLVGRVDGKWKVVDRSPGRAFDDARLQDRYQGFFDDPAPSR